MQIAVHGHRQELALPVFDRKTFAVLGLDDEVQLFVDERMGVRVVVDRIVRFHQHFLIRADDQNMRLEPAVLLIEHHLLLFGSLHFGGNVVGGFLQIHHDVGDALGFGIDDQRIIRQPLRAHTSASLVMTGGLISGIAPSSTNCPEKPPVSAANISPAEAKTTPAPKSASHDNFLLINTPRTDWSAGSRIGFRKRGIPTGQTLNGPSARQTFSLAGPIWKIDPPAKFFEKQNIIPNRLGKAKIRSLPGCRIFGKFNVLGE